ncbi:hypothetical protein [Novosphingobium sp. MD-1]|uniref:hypothetical protein n=1 Tax=Novosphingobium sp. MD-1 TaxID=1630648 RepID=UPI00061C328C|nr:hypothetical protein [Novosphingobium sp. MD-1]GAO53495.1 hypothetical protein NMD1_00501 [Novosphingobium sp. MD-1]
MVGGPGPDRQAIAKHGRGAPTDIAAAIPVAPLAATSEPVIGSSGEYQRKIAILFGGTVWPDYRK